MTSKTSEKGDGPIESNLRFVPRLVYRGDKLDTLIPGDVMTLSQQVPKR